MLFRSREILGRLRFSAEETGQVVSLVAHHMDWMHVREMRASTLRRFMRLPLFEEHQELHRLDCESSHRRLESYEFVRAQLAALSAQDLRPAPLITGHDLISAGMTAGPLFSAILTELENAQLEQRIGTAEEALAMAREIYRSRS